MWVVLHSDLRQGEGYVNGPFDNHELACAWAKRFATDRAAEYSMVTIGEESYWAVLTDRSDEAEIVTEVTVMELIKPYN